MNESEVIAAWNEHVNKVREALDQFSNRDAISIFFEWLADQPGAHQGPGTTEGFEEYFVASEEQAQGELYITLNEA
jgi:hypothetical protein